MKQTTTTPKSKKQDKATAATFQICITSTNDQHQVIRYQLPAIPFIQALTEAKYQKFDNVFIFQLLLHMPSFIIARKQGKFWKTTEKICPEGLKGA